MDKSHDAIVFRALLRVHRRNVELDATPRHFTRPPVLIHAREYIRLECDRAGLPPNHVTENHLRKLIGFEFYTNCDKYEYTTKVIHASNSKPARLLTRIDENRNIEIPDVDAGSAVSGEDCDF